MHESLSRQCRDNPPGRERKSRSMQTRGSWQTPPVRNNIGLGSKLEGETHATASEKDYCAFIRCSARIQSILSTILTTMRVPLCTCHSALGYLVDSSLQPVCVTIAHGLCTAHKISELEISARLFTTLASLKCISRESPRALLSKHQSPTTRTHRMQASYHVGCL